MKDDEHGQIFTKIVIETFKLSGLLVAEGDRISAPLGLTSARWKVLGALASSETPLTASSIARNMGQSRQAVQTIINILSDAGLIVLVDNPDHKRAKLAALTAEGERTYQDMMAIQTPWAKQCSEDISVDDLNTTLATLQKLSNRF